MKLSEAERAILHQLSGIPDGQIQRIDGLRCSGKVLDLSDWKFNWGIRLLRLRGAISRHYRPNHTIWPSCRDMPFFAITPAGRAALEQQDD